MGHTLMALFNDEEEMQETAQRIVRQLNRIEVAPVDRELFLSGASVPHAYRPTLEQALSGFPPAHYYVIISYVRLGLDRA
jgi:hypothetical protein